MAPGLGGLSVARGVGVLLALERAGLARAHPGARLLVRHAALLGGLALHLLHVLLAHVREVLAALLAHGCPSFAVVVRRVSSVWQGPGYGNVAAGAGARPVGCWEKHRPPRKE